MNFTFTEDQILFADTVGDFLTKECDVESLRALADTQTGRSDDRWAKIAEMGLPGLLVPEAQGGMGFGDIDFVLIAEHCGRAALPEPLIETALATALLAKVGGDRAAEALGEIAEGARRVSVGHPINPFVADAHYADQLLLAHEGEVHLVDVSDTTLTLQKSIDPFRRLYKVDWTPSEGTRIASAKEGTSLWAETLNRGALYAAAQCTGLGARMVQMAVDYTSERQQFGQAIGAFQAVKHHLATVQVRLEFARPVITRAAQSLMDGHAEVDAHISQAKIAASDAAEATAKAAIQVHGAMGYTAEVDLHYWMKRTWALQGVWGDKSFHLARLDERVMKSAAPIGPGETF